MDLDRLYKILDDTTSQLRKGEEVTEHKVGNLQVTEIFAMTHESEAKVGVKVDMHFITILVDKEKAEKYKAELVQILKDWPSEVWEQEIPKLEQGPSYIHVGGVLGDQGLALQLFALGKVLGLWKVITPKNLGITGSRADEIAGSGFIMIEGYRP